jgi:hypothetical protein
MGWKQTLILGGAVLLLAACDRATAPITNVRDGGAAANRTAKSSLTAPSEPNALDSTSAAPEAPVAQDLIPCGISISSGELVPIDSVCTDW